MKEHRRYYNSFWEDAAMEKGKMILFPKEVKKEMFWRLIHWSS